MALMNSTIDNFYIIVILFAILAVLWIALWIWYQIKFSNKYKNKKSDYHKTKTSKSELITKEYDKNKDR